MNDFTFDNSIDPKTGKKRHIYKLNGKRLTGTTTVLGVIAKPMLIPWASRMACEYIKANYKGELTDELLEEAKHAHRKKKEEAGEKGTDVHAEIERWINETIHNQNMTPQCDYPKWENNQNKQVRHFIDWAIKNKVQFLESEKKMYSKTHWVAGTADFLCKIDGQTYLGDIKTSSGIYDRTPFAQCASYRMMLKEMTGQECDGSIIVNLKKTGKFNEDEDVHLSVYYEDDLNLFLSALQIYRIMGSFEPMNNYKSNKKTIRI